MELTNKKKYKLTLLVYLSIFTYIYFTKSILFTNYKYKIFAIFTILFSPPMTPEVWMSSAHLRGYFGIFSFVLLFHDYKNDAKISKFITKILIFFSGICSVYAAALTPAYFLKFYLKKNKENFYSFVFAALACVIQLIVIINKNSFDMNETTRFDLQIETFYSYFYNIPIRSFFGSYLPKILFLHTDIYKLNYFYLFVYFSLISTILIGLLYLKKKNDKISFIIFVSLFFVSLLIVI